MKTKLLFLTTVVIILLSCSPADKTPIFIDDNTYRFYMNNWECTVINEGEMSVPLSAFFNAENLKKLEKVVLAYDIDTTAIDLGINILILRNKKNTIVIDPGIGKQMATNSGSLMEKLKTAEIDSAEVNYVIISHGHYDHIGGLAAADGSLYFPNAQYVIAEKEWKFWTNYDNLEQFPKFWEQFAREDLPPIKDKLILVEQEKEIVPGITVRSASGHTPGQISILISSGNEELIYLADAVILPFQIAAPKASPIFDMDPEMAINTRVELIEEAFKNNTKVFGYHFTFPGVGSIEKGEKFERKFKKL